MIIECIMYEYKYSDGSLRFALQHSIEQKKRNVYDKPEMFRWSLDTGDIIKFNVNGRIFKGMVLEAYFMPIGYNNPPGYAVGEGRWMEFDVYCFQKKLVHISGEDVLGLIQKFNDEMKNFKENEEC